MVDGESSILPISERLQRLRQYSSNFRNGIFYHEGSTAQPDYWRRLRQLGWLTPMNANDSSTSLYGSLTEEQSHQLLSVFNPGSVQAGIRSQRWLIPVASPVEEGRPRPNVRVWAIDCVQDLVVLGAEEMLPDSVGSDRCVLSIPFTVETVA